MIGALLLLHVEPLLVFAQHPNPRVPGARSHPLGEEGVLRPAGGKTRGGHPSLWRKCELLRLRKRVEMPRGCWEELAKGQGVKWKEQAVSLLVQNRLVWLAGPVGTD